MGDDQNHRFQYSNCLLLGDLGVTLMISQKPPSRAGWWFQPEKYESI